MNDEDDNLIDQLQCMPQMVRWFDPLILLKIIRPVFWSSVFGTHADRCHPSRFSPKGLAAESEWILREIRLLVARDDLIST